jgi:class 3 adenylate cyclase
VVTPIVSERNDELVGAIMMGLQVVDFGGLERSAPVQSGIVLGGSLFSSSIPVTLRKQLLRSLSTATREGPDEATSFDIQLNDEPYRCFVKALNPGSVFPVALNMSLYSLVDQDQDIRVMRLRVLAFGSLVFLIGCLLAWLISQRLAIPLNELVVGTQEIEKGNYDYKVRVRSRDEVGKLASSFNQMAVGLALKEKYQSVLNQVTDREVARELMSGQLALGGVMLPVSVLFCDIRGFSVMSQKLPPAAVVQMLNEHMTAMTRIAYEFHGVVDKFVGDMIMVVFGAPKSYGNDGENAVCCAVKLIASRRELNVRLADKIDVGIGIATGEVLAGCMGSEDRLNYTVLGEKVNLGSRLCDTADRMQILMDEETHRLLGDLTKVEALDGIELKGFEGPVTAYRVIRLRER